MRATNTRRAVTLPDGDHRRRAAIGSSGRVTIEEGRRSQRIAHCKQKKVIFAGMGAWQPKASNRQIAKTLNVGQDTVRRVLGAKAPAGSKKTNQNKGRENDTGAKAPPTPLTGAAAAKIIERRHCNWS